MQAEKELKSASSGAADQIFEYDFICDPLPRRIFCTTGFYFYPSVELRAERSSLQAVLALLKKCIVSTLGLDGVVNNDIVEVLPDPTQDKSIPQNQTKLL